MVIDSNTQAPIRSSAGGGMDWDKVITMIGTKGIVGAISAGLIALIFGVVSIFKKRKKD